LSWNRPSLFLSDAGSKNLSSWLGRGHSNYCGGVFAVAVNYVVNGSSLDRFALPPVLTKPDPKLSFLRGDCC
jgi:hypothetical protein